MKKLMVLFTATLVCAGAFGQGKLAFINNSTQLIYVTSDTTKLLAADAGKTVAGFALAGSSLYTGAGSTVSALSGAPNGFTIALFGGTSASSLSLQTTATLGNANFGGFINQVNVTFPSLPAGTAAFFQFEIYDSRASSAANAWATLNSADATGTHSYYAAESPVFSAVPQTSVYSPIYQVAAPVSSTLPNGTYVPKDYAAFPGYSGLMPVYATVVPEPGTFALAGLGLASLLIFRRRK